MQDLAVFEHFVHIQAVDQASGAKISGIVSREMGQKEQVFCGFGRYFFNSI